MYEVTAAYKAETKRAQRVEHIRGRVGNIAIDDHNFLSLEYSNRCTDTNDIRFGSAYVGQITAELINISIPRGSWQGLEIILEYGLELSELATEWIPVGVFTISEAVWTARGIKITAYDVMAKLDRPFTASTTYGTPFDLLSLAAELTGIELGQTQTEIEALPNGTELLGLYPNNDISTVRDFVSWIASACGAFATADRSGHLIIKSWGDLEVVDTLTAHDRIAGASFSDFTTAYSGITIEDQIAGGLKYYLVQDASGPVIALGANPLLQQGLDETKDAQRQAVANVAAGMNYTPFDAELLNNPAYDLGDLIYCEEGIAGDEPLTVCVMAINWRLKQTIDLRGFGKDPNLAAGKTKAEKALNGLKNKTSENEMIIHTFVNAQAIGLPDDIERDIISIDFSTIQPRTVLILHEINLDVEITDESGLATVQAFYYLNDTLESYSPVETYDEDGKHILSLMYPLDNLLGGTAYNWRVALKMNGGTATIGRGDARAILEGQGLLALDEFDGTLKFEDAVEAWAAMPGFEPISEELQIIRDEPQTITLSDSVASWAPMPDFAAFDYTFSITAEPVPAYLVDENGNYLTDENGNRLTTL